MTTLYVFLLSLIKFHFYLDFCFCGIAPSLTQAVNLQPITNDYIDKTLHPETIRAEFLKKVLNFVLDSESNILNNEL